MTGEFDAFFLNEVSESIPSFLRITYFCKLMLTSFLYFRINVCFVKSSGGTWVTVASQATPKSWGDRSSQFHRVDQRKAAEQRSFSQVKQTLTAWFHISGSAHVRCCLVPSSTPLHNTLSVEYHAFLIFVMSAE